MKEQLTAAIAKEHKAKVTANVAESNTVCQALEMDCTKQLAGLDGLLQVPSMYQFEGRHKACMRRFEVSSKATRRDQTKRRCACFRALELASAGGLM